MIYITRQVCQTTITLVVRSRLMGTHQHPNASVAGIWSITSLKGKVLVPEGRVLGRFRYFLDSGRGW